MRTPDWVKHAVFYQIFPDRFAIGKTANYLTATAQLESWEAPPTYHGFKGGNLWGVRERLDYLQDLGITAIYFTPVFQSAANHRYHTHDYYQVDPLLGGNEALTDLMNAAHQRGMKVVLDGVFNHASRGFFFFNDILENGDKSPWLDWFRIDEFPLAPYDEQRPANYAGWWGLRALPEFNHDHAPAREYLMQVGEYWIRQGIDGWRLDVPNCVKTPGFWEEFRQRIKAINPDAYIVGEIWEDARPWLDGKQFDGVMNYLFTGATIAFAAGDRVVKSYVERHSYGAYPALDAAGYARRIEHLLRLYDWEIQLAQLNLLDSHDTARLLTIAGGDECSVELATLLLMTYPGAPSIYYGDEVGLPGGVDPDCRRGFPPAAAWNADTLDYHRQLIALRRTHPALRTGSYRILYALGYGYVFVRVLQDDAVIVAVNMGDTAIAVHIPVGDVRSHPAKMVYGTGKAVWRDGMLELRIAARSGFILA